MDKYYCNFCNKEFKSIAGKNGHQPTCKFNPNKISGWSKGLTKDTDERINKISKKVRETENSEEWKNTIGKNKSDKLKISCGHESWNKGLTKETSEILKETGMKISSTWTNKSEEEKDKFRKIQRDITVKRISENGNKRFTNTKPEIRFKKLLEFYNIKYEQNYPFISIKHSYPVDFYLSDYKLVVEVDGEYWHNYPEYRPIDIIRSQELINSNYYIFRIWSEMIDILEDNPDIFLEHLKNIKIDLNLS